MRVFEYQRKADLAVGGGQSLSGCQTDRRFSFQFLPSFSPPHLVFAPGGQDGAGEKAPGLPPHPARDEGWTCALQGDQKIVK